MTKFVNIYSGFLNYAHAMVVQIQTMKKGRVALDKNDPRELIEMLIGFLKDHNHNYELLCEDVLYFHLRGDDGEIGNLFHLKYPDFDPLVKTYALNFFSEKNWTKPAALLEYELQLTKKLEAEKKDNVIKPVTAEEIGTLLRVKDSAYIQKINEGLRAAANEGHPSFTLTLPSETLTHRISKLYKKEGFTCFYYERGGDMILEFDLSVLKDECP